jgi:predicted helicase
MARWRTASHNRVDAGSPKGHSNSNFRPNLIPFLKKKYGNVVTPEDLMSYIAAIAAQPKFTAEFQGDLSTPGLYIPLTADPHTFTEAVQVGRRVIWLHTFGDRMTDPDKGRPSGPARLPGHSGRRHDTRRP